MNTSTTDRPLAPAMPPTPALIRRTYAYTGTLTGRKRSSQERRGAAAGIMSA
ncbi:hypothetical protein AB0J35_03940 [Nonomuraea angiospora]|uniref:hypothetical protein n=1 Tax=Nonomuraea angiospora TaxID=46172 RepID=UPI003423F3F6